MAMATGYSGMHAQGGRSMVPMGPMATTMEGGNNYGGGNLFASQSGLQQLHATEQYGSKQKEHFDTALIVLHGGELSLWTAAASFVVAFTAVLFGIAMVAIAPCAALFEKCFSLLATVFLIIQSFTIVSVLRNSALAEMAEGIGAFPLKGVEFMKGQPLYKLAMVSGLALAILCTIYGILVLPHETLPGAPTSGLLGVTPEKLLMLIATMFTMTSSLNLAAVLRDRFDADVWLTHYEATPNEAVDVCLLSTMECAMQTCTQMKQLFLVTVIISAVLLIYGFATFPMEHGSMVIMGTVLMIFLVYNLAKAVEDDDDDPSNNKTEPTAAVFLLTVGLFLFALVRSVTGWNVKGTLFLGVVFVATSVFCYTKSANKLKRVKAWRDQVQNVG